MKKGLVAMKNISANIESIERVESSPRFLGGKNTRPHRQLWMKLDHLKRFWKMLILAANSTL